jgi:glycerophosphoryl diester phosphodiesterase
MIDIPSLIQAIRRVKAEFWRLLEFDVFFTILTLALLQPAVALLAGLSISSTGYPTVSNDQLISFFLSMKGLLTVLLFGSGTFAVFFAQQAGLQIIDITAGSDRRVTGVEAIWLATKRLPALTRLGGMMILVSAVAALPILIAVRFTYSALLSGADINFYLAEKPPEFLAAVAIGCFLLAVATLVALILLGRWMLAVPAVLFEGAGARTALRRSVELGRGRRTKWVVTILVWTAALAVLTILVTIAFNQLGSLAIRTIGDRLNLLLVALGSVVIGYLAILAIVSFVGVAINSVFINVQYANATADIGDGSTLATPLAPERSAKTAARFRRINSAAWVVAVILLIISAATTLFVVHGFGMSEPPAITAHRGSSARAPENTIVAIEAAIEDGADYAEIDVQETADGVVVMLHDADLMRLGGVNWRIWETDYAELVTLDVGSWFAPEFAGERIATLEEVIGVARGRIRLNIELKYNGHDVRLAERVVDVLRETDFVDDVVVSSLELDGLLEVEALNDSIETGFIVAKAVGNLASIDVDFFAVSTSFATSVRIANWQRNGKAVHVWTVNSRPEMSRYIDMGVENILTDHPAVLKAMLEEREQLDETQRILIAFRNWLQN